MGKRILLDKDLLYEKYVIEECTQKETAKFFNRSVDCIVSNLKYYNIPCHKNGYKAHIQKIFLNDEQKNYLYGAMLGDGCLYKNKNGVNSQLTYISKSFQHVDFVANPFKDILYKEGIKSSSYFDKRTNKIYKTYSFRTITDVAFENERKIWYPNNIKIIPPDLKLNNTICLIWYIGDGGVINSKKSPYIKLSTQCFKLEDQENILLPQLKDFEASICKGDKSKSGEQQYFIYIPRRRANNFLEYIGRCPFPDYEYKWKIKEYKNKINKNQKDNEKYFVKLYLDGLKCREISKIYNVDFNTVKKYLVKNNIYKGY